MSKKHAKKEKKNKRQIEEEENQIDTKQGRIKSFFKRLLILALLLCLIIGCIFLAYRAIIFKNLAKEMFNNELSIVYDSDGNEIAQIGTERKKIDTDYLEIPENLKNAYVAIEDQRYYSHHGVDVRRTGAAIISYVFNGGSSSFGGSTITQQLVKNLTGDDSNTITRKVKEWYLAFVLECSFSKDEILDAYLNIIYTGPNIYGVGTASIYYFNKDVSDLSLAECAFLAGINNSPNSYNPFSDEDRTEKIETRTKTVLSKMLELEYITQTEYDEAVSEVENGLNFSKGEIENNSSVYSYHTDALVNEIISDFADKKNITSDFATNYFYLSGSKIYSTVDSDIQEILEDESTNSKYIIQSSNGTDTSQAAMVVIDQSTGYVVGCTRWFGRKNRV